MKNDSKKESPASGGSGEIKSKEKLMKFWRVDCRMFSRSVGFEMLNEDTLIKGTGLIIVAPPPGKRGFHDFPEAPKLLIDKRLGRPLRDMEIYTHYWLISPAAKSLFESLAKDAFAFCKCETQLPNGEQGPEYWLCDVLPTLDAVDEQASDLGIEIKGDFKFYRFTGGFDIRLRKEVVKNQKIFRLVYAEFFIICDDSFKVACKGIKGIHFSPLKK